MSDGTSPTSTRSPSRILESSTDDADIQKNVDSLFKVYTIQEVTKSLSKLKLENSRLKSDLFSLIGENYGKILEAADAVQSMKHRALEIERTFTNLSQAQAAGCSEENAPDKMDNFSTKIKEDIDNIMNCPIVAWKMFKDGSMIKSIQHCTNSLVYLKRNREQLQQTVAVPLLNCMELQIINAQTRIKRAVTNVLENDADVNLENFSVEKLKESLLVHSGLFSKTHYTDEDLRLAFMACWEPRACREDESSIHNAVLKNVQMLIFGSSLLVPPADLAKKLNANVDPLRSLRSGQQIVDQTLIEALNCRSLSDLHLQSIVQELSVECFRAWLKETWDSHYTSGGYLGLAVFKLISSFQYSYSIEKQGIQFKERSAMLREFVEGLLPPEDLLHLDSFNLILPCLHPEITAIPPKKLMVDETASVFNMVPVFPVDFTL